MSCICRFAFCDCNCALQYWSHIVCYICVLQMYFAIVFRELCFATKFYDCLLQLRFATVFCNCELQLCFAIVRHKCVAIVCLLTTLGLDSKHTLWVMGINKSDSQSHFRYIYIYTCICIYIYTYLFNRFAHSARPVKNIWWECIPCNPSIWIMFGLRLFWKA